MRFKFILLSIIFRVALDVAYYSIISKYFSYQGFDLISDSIALIVLSYLLIVITSFVIPMNTHRPSEFIVTFLYLVNYVPTTSLMALGGFPILPAVELTLVFLFLFILFRIKLTFKYSFQGNKKVLLLITATSAVVMTTVLFYNYGFLKIPSLFEVYERRALYIKTLENPLISYFLHWDAQIIIPFIAAWAFLEKRYIISLTAIFVQIYIFSIAGHKSHLFAIIFIFWILVGLKFFRQNLQNYVVLSFIILVFSCYVIDYVSSGFIMSSLFTHRLFFIPSQMFYYYVDFFSNNPHTYLSQSWALSWLLDYPYDLPIPNMIGLYYFSNIETYANANIFADAYASFGTLGMFIFAFILWLIGIFIDVISNKKNPYLVYTLLAMPTFSLTNVALQTTLITHGLLLSAMLIIFLPQQNIRSFTKRS